MTESDIDRAVVTVRIGRHYYLVNLAILPEVRLGA